MVRELALELLEVGIRLEFPFLIPMKDLFDKSAELFKGMNLISKLRDEEGPLLKLEDDEGITYSIREKEMEVSGPLKEEDIRTKAFKIAEKILKFLNKKEQPRVISAIYECRKPKSFKIVDTIKNDLAEKIDKIGVHLVCMLLFDPKEEKFIDIRHRSRSDYLEGNITIHTNDLKFAEKIIQIIESSVRKGG